MKILRNICILVSASFLFACEGDTFYLIPDNQKPVFKEGDRLVYQSNYGRKDTFKVTEVVHTFDYTTPKANSDKLNFYEYIHYEITRIKNKKIDSAFVNNIDHYYGGEVYYYWDNTYQYLDSYRKSIDSLVVNEKTYYNIHQIDLFEGEGSVNKIYCNNQYGVIRYEYPYQVHWELIEYKPNTTTTPNKNMGAF